MDCEVELQLPASVLIMIPTTRDLPHQTVFSLLETQRACAHYDVEVRILIEPDQTGVTMARSICLHRFLHETEMEKAFFIDSDIKWQAHTFLRMLAISTMCDAVIGAYSTKSDEPMFLLNTPGEVRSNEYGCIPAASGGLGFSIIDRKAIKDLYDRAPERKLRRGNGIPSLHHVFREDVDLEGYHLSEDIVFFNDLSRLGYKIWCDPTMVLGHIGQKVYEGSLQDHVVKKQAAERVNRPRLVIAE